MRLEAIDLDELDRLTVKDWATRSFYLENIPAIGSTSKNITLPSLKIFLSELLGSPLEALRLPRLFNPAAASSERMTITAESRQRSDNLRSLADRDSKAARDRKGKQKEKIDCNLPANGGLFKGYAFVVLKSVAKANAALERWNWENRGRVATFRARATTQDDDENDSDVEEGGHEISDDQQDELDALEIEAYLLGKPAKQPQSIVSLQEQADLCGFRVMPMSVPCLCRTTFKS